MKLSSHLCRGCMHIKTKIRAASMTARKRSPDPDRERNAAFRSRSWQDAGQLSEDLTYSDQADITVTDSRSFSPHSTCKHMACANYPIFIFYYYSIEAHNCQYHFLILYAEFCIAVSEKRNNMRRFFSAPRCCKILRWCPCRRRCANPIARACSLHLLLHEIQSRARLDAFGGGLFVNRAIEIRCHLLFDDLLDGLGRII